MFETKEPTNTSSMWKILPLALAGVVVVIVAVTLLSGPDQVREVTGVVHAGDQAYELYKDSVRLNQPKASLTRRITGARAVVFTGVIENLGEKTLDVVEVKLSLFNYEEFIWSIVRTPVKPGAFTSSIGPREKKRFDLYVEDLPGVDDLPKEWLSTHAEIDIHGFRFAED